MDVSGLESLGSLAMVVLCYLALVFTAGTLTLVLGWKFYRHQKVPDAEVGGPPSNRLESAYTLSLLVTVFLLALPFVLLIWNRE